MKKLEIAVLDAGLFDVGKIEQILLKDIPLNPQSKTGPDIGQDMSSDAKNSLTISKDNEKSLSP
jgi:hypothetical protein